MKTSSYEQKIIKILQKEHIAFQKEKTFPDLNKGFLRYDFWIPSLNIIIECDGEQHFHHVFGSRTQFLHQQENDRKKNSYCLAHKIPLYRIPYWKIGELNCFNDLLEEQFRVKSKFHNDYLKEKKK